jgi:hypothetical protein
MVENPVLLHEKNDMLDIRQRACKSRARTEGCDCEGRCQHCFVLTIKFSHTVLSMGILLPLYQAIMSAGEQRCKSHLP